MENSSAKVYQEILIVTFRAEEEIVRFVETCRKYDDAIDVISGQMQTDAKSIMGMLLMPVGEPLEIEYGCYDDEDNYQQFRAEVLQKYQIEVRPVEPKKAEAGEAGEAET
jgi:phosphotransferase system HPr-like phosphotransfer protein